MLTPTPRRVCYGHSSPLAAPQGPQRGYFFAVPEVTEPRPPRAVAFVDGQNLYHGARRAFGHRDQHLDIVCLAHAVCEPRGWRLLQTRYYTGLPSHRISPEWHRFWSAELRRWQAQGVQVYSRPLRYRRRTVLDESGRPRVAVVGEEKGIDVRISLDVIQMAIDCEFDVALLLSQDQDFVELARDVRSVAQRQGRWIKMASAYPAPSGATAERGVDKTDWITIDRATYDACLVRFGER